MIIQKYLIMINKTYSKIPEKDKDYIPGSDTTDTDCEDLLTSRAKTFIPEERVTDNPHSNIVISQVKCEIIVNMNKSEQ